jgi:hypothetical protein
MARSVVLHAPLRGTPSGREIIDISYHQEQVCALPHLWQPSGHPKIDMEGLVAPEGAYTSSYSYLLPPAPSYPPNVPNVTTLQGNTAKDASTIGSGTGSIGSASGSGSTTSAILLGINIASAQNGAGNVGTSNGAADGQGENGLLNAEAEMARTALHHISMQAPSAWSHVPVVPPSRISVASIRYPGTTSGARKDRQQTSYANASEVYENNNGSDSSLSGIDAGSGTKDQIASPPIGPILEAALASQGIDGPASHVTGGQGGLPGMAALQLLAHLGGGPPASMTASMTGNLGGSSTGTKNLLKPKNNIKQTSSSFVQRLQTHSEYTKLFGPRTEGNTLERFAFVSRGRILYWLGETANGWIKVSVRRVMAFF